MHERITLTMIHRVVAGLQRGNHMALQIKTASPKLTVPEAAAHLKLSKSFLDKLRLRGNGPAYLKLGTKRVVYDLNDLEAWVKRCRRRHTSEA